MRLLPLLRTRYRVFAVTRDPAHMAALRAAGAVPILADLDRRDSLARLAGLAHRVIHLAPPPAQGGRDSRTRNVSAILPEAARVVYVSTTGVYGDLAGRLVDETQPVAPRNGRALRRVDAEGTLRQWARGAHGRLAILRVPGIYAADRLPLARLHQGTPALLPADDVFTNHIHADDLAAILLRALQRGRPQRVYHAVDDSAMKMADYFDAVADAYGLARPPRLARTALAEVVSPTLLSYMSESRRLANARLKDELRITLRYPTVAEGLQAALRQARPEDG
ncbi:NAD-dependent epimerase/dehydratase family protein [Pseudoduganella lurida]|nr:NAD-dependent epimerase/dehydratase family protein [Pseudoduganella lurida]